MNDISIKQDVVTQPNTASIKINEPCVLQRYISFTSCA